MASIPLAEIPGVPALAAPVLGDGIRARASAQGLLSDTVSPGAFAGPGQGAEELGRAVAGTAGVFSQLATRMQEAQNVGDVAKADAAMQDAYGQHAQESMTLPPEQRVALWENKYRPMVEKQIAGLNLSPQASAQVQPQWISFDAKTRTNIAYDAYKAKIMDSEQAVNNQIDRQVRNKDFEGAKATADQFKAFAFPDAAIEKKKIDIDQKAWEANEYEQTQAMAAAIDMDPKGAIPELQKAVRGEASTFGIVEPIKAKRFLAMAEREDKNRKIELRTNLHNRVLSGDILDPETLRKEAGGKLDESVLKSLEKVMGKEIPFDPEKFGKIRTKIAAFNASTDKDGKQLDSLMSEIETTIPQNRQGPLNSELSQAWNATVRQNKPRTQKQEAVASLMGEIDGMADRGYFAGKWKTGTGEKAVVDQKVKLDNWAKAEAVKDEMRTFGDKNPDATSQEVLDHLRGIITPDAAKAAEKEIQDMERSGKFGYSKPLAEMAVDWATGGPSPATVRNNNPGGMWFVGGWQRKYGAEFGEPLKDGLGQGNQIAKFPDAISGAAAQMHLLSNYGNVTVGEAIKKWSGGNDVPSYLSVLGKGGFGAEDNLREIMADPDKAEVFTQLMSEHETGKKFPLDAAGWKSAYKKFREVKG